MMQHKRLWNLMMMGALTMVFSVVYAQGADVMNGTWKLNLAMSTYSPGPAPQSQTVKIDGTDEARVIAVDVTTSTGTALHWEVSGAVGKELPVVGNNPNADMYVLKRIDAVTLEAQYMKSGKPTLKHTAVVSADGKMLTVTASGTDAQGQTVNNVAMYDK